MDPGWRPVWLLQAALGGFLGVELTVAVVERLLILRDCLVAAVLEVIHAAEVYVRPGEEPRIVAEPDGLLEVVASLFDVALHDGAAGEQEVGACRVAGVAIELLMGE